MRRVIILGIALGIAIFVIGAALCSAVSTAAERPTVQYCYVRGPANQPVENWQNQNCLSQPAARGNWHLAQIIVRDSKGVFDRLRTPRWRQWNGYQTGEVLLCLSKTNRYPIQTDGINDENDVTFGMWVRCEDSDTWGQRY
jgi:hypothetical protein